MFGHFKFYEAFCIVLCGLTCQMANPNFKYPQIKEESIWGHITNVGKLLWFDIGAHIINTI